jgi:hypothetical protein
MHYVEGCMNVNTPRIMDLFKSGDEIASNAAPIGQEMNKAFHYRDFQCNRLTTANIHTWAGEMDLLLKSRIFNWKIAGHSNIRPSN